MTLEEAVYARHSVRSYTGEALAKEAAFALEEEIGKCNKEGGLSIRLVQNEPKAFKSFLAKYGKFSGVTSYIVLAGEQADDLRERAGYYGERLVLSAQTLGLNTCWAALSFGKGAAKKSAGLKRAKNLSASLPSGTGKRRESRTKAKLSTTLPSPRMRPNGSGRAWNLPCSRPRRPISRNSALPLSGTRCLRNVRVAFTQI